MSCLLPVPFNPREVAPATGGGNQLPVSDEKGHVVIITEAEIKPTKDNKGAILALTLKVVDGPSAGQTGVFNLNIQNDNLTTTRIAFAELSAICHSVGFMQTLQDVTVLFNKPFRVIVGLQKDSEAAAKGYTEVKAIRDVNGNKPGQSGPASREAPAPAPSPSPAPPANWPSQLPPLASQQPPAQAPAPQHYAPAPQQFAPAPPMQAPPGMPQAMAQQFQPQQPPQQQPQQYAIDPGQAPAWATQPSPG